MALYPRKNGGKHESASAKKFNHLVRIIMGNWVLYNIFNYIHSIYYHPQHHHIIFV